jgi:hypothetical protein
MAHAGLTRAIRHAEANDKVRRNVATLVDAPAGQGGPPVRVAHLRSGRRPDPGGTPVWLVRLRCLEPPGRRPHRGGAGAAMGSRRLGRQPGRRAACTSPCRRLALGTCPRRHQDEEVPALAGTAQDGGGSARRAAATAGSCAAAGRNSLAGQRARLHDCARDTTRCRRCAPIAPDDLPESGIAEEWTPRELRHTFVSLLSDNGMAIEEISRLVGHSSSNVTETVYRHQIRPVINVGAEAMDKIFANEQ